MKQQTTLPQSRSRLSRVIRWIALAIGLLILALGVLAYQYQTVVLRDIANRLLASYGIEIVDMTGVLLGRSQVAISAVEFRYADQPYAQSLRQIRIDYHPAAALTGFIDAVHIAEAHLYSEVWPLPLPDGAAPSAPSAPSAPAGTSTRAPDAGTNPALVAPQLPFGQLTVDSVQIEIAAAATNLQAHVRLHADTFNDGELALAAELHDISLAQAHLSAEDLSATTLDARVPYASIECRGLGDCRVRADAEITLGQLTQTDLQIDGISLTTAFNGRLANGILTARSTAASTLRIDEARYGPHTASMMELELAGELYVDYDPDEQLITASMNQLSGTLPMLRPVAAENLLGLNIDIHQFNGDYRLPAGSLQRLAAEDLQFTADVTLSQVYTNMLPYNIWLHRFNQQISWQSPVVTVSSLVGVGDIAVITLDLQQNWDTGEGAARAAIADLNFTPDGINLSHVLSPLPAAGDIVTGNVSASSQLSWQIAPSELLAGRWPTTLAELSPSGTLSLSLDNLGGFYMETAFAGVSTNVDIELKPDGTARAIGRTPLTIEAIDAGLQVNNASVTYELDSAVPEAYFRDMSVNVFGGRLHSDSFQYGFADANGELLIRIENIDLSEVLAMSAYDAVSATGLISGHLPVRIRQGTPLVTGGQLRAHEPGGTIHYDSGSAASGNQNLDLVYQALRNYRFDLLEADVDYKEDGELALAVRMQGVSPELNEGQRINLNLNITDNVPALLESLQAGRSVTDLVEQRLDPAR